MEDFVKVLVCFKRLIRQAQLEHEQLIDILIELTNLLVNHIDNNDDDSNYQADDDNTMDTSVHEYICDDVSVCEIVELSHDDLEKRDLLQLKFFSHNKFE